MLSDNELETYLLGLRIPEAGRRYVIETRQTAPTRQVGRGAEQSVRGLTYSQINGATRCFESREELAYIRHLERESDSILEYHAQPAQASCYIHDRLGRARHSWKTPDFLVLRTDEIHVLEVKTTENATRLVHEHPKDWTQDGAQFRFLPLERHFETLGLCYEVVLAEKVTRIGAKNNDLLHRVRMEVEQPSDQTIATITSRLAQAAFVTLGNIRQQHGQQGFEAALWLIERNIAHAALEQQSLVDDCAIIAADKKLLDVAMENSPSTGQPNDNAVDATMVGGRKAIEHYIAFQGAEHQSNRTGRRYRQKLKQLETDEPRCKALMPAFHKRGNWNPKIAPEVADFLEKFIEDIPKRNFPSKKRAFVAYSYEAKQTHPNCPPVSDKTFAKRYAQLNTEQLARACGGKRAANQSRQSAPVAARHARALRPFERVVMDHTLADLFITVAEANENVSIVRPWLTIVTDEATGYILEFLISLKQPSRRVFALVFRQLARKYGKVFEAIHTDGGKDMDSVFTRQLSAEYEFTYSISPSANSRYNGLAESVFASLKTSFIKDYPANCVEWKKRSRSRGFQPTDKVCDDLNTLYPKFNIAIEAHNDKIVSGHIYSRKIQFQEMIRKFPMSGIHTEINDAFYLATSYDVGDYKISNRGTIQKLNRHYSPVDDTLLTGSRRCEVRQDCENPYLIYYLKENQWRLATAAGYERFQSQSENVRKLEGALQLEATEARTELNKLAVEQQHAMLVALAEEDRRKSLEAKKRRNENGKRKSVSPQEDSDIFRFAKPSAHIHDELEE